MGGEWSASRFAPKEKAVIIQHTGVWLNKKSVWTWCREKSYPFRESSDFCLENCHSKVAKRNPPPPTWNSVTSVITHPSSTYLSTYVQYK